MHLWHTGDYWTIIVHLHAVGCICCIQLCDHSVIREVTDVSEDIVACDATMEWNVIL